MAHHLRAHWVDEDEGSGTSTHHHLSEHWEIEDEPPLTPTLEPAELNASS
jgi:hypothetical protein